ncbi:hypothetical protein V498_02659 [Pseudogymnoascus sp. VKM F-4517 (FW-2822)]|nr:hypothetical protein V498_02659 [Pseudogymnoascus sp. VKM F-4517 (FW-2822)]
MGQGFSLQALSAGPGGIDVPELSDLTYEKSMGSARFMKSIRARHEDGVVLVKVVVKPYVMKLDKYRKRIIEEREALADIPNALGYERIIETENNGYLVRQYLYSSLYDRMSTRPFLEDIEKKWLAFQLLCALRDCHARDVFHGDIKSENTLVTSWNWLYLSDFSSSFKPTTLPEDNPADFSYFFDTAGRRTCYLAPERFLSPGQKADPKASITWAMDVFSAGCVIAELFLETPIFNLSQLYQYKKGEYDPLTRINGIANKDIRDMVAHMIQLEPEARYSAEEYLNFWRNKAFPEYFYGFLHQYMGLITDPTSGRAPITGSSVNLGEADDRIDRIYYDFDKISYFLGYQNPRTEGEQTRLNASQFRLQLLPVHLNIPNNDHQISNAGSRPEDDGTLIFLTVVASSVRNTARAATRARACDLLLAFAERLTDEAKLDRVLPYMVSLLNDKSDIVKVSAIRTLTQLMTMVKVISPVNAHVFQEYILDRMAPFLANTKTNPSPIVRATYAACLGSLATAASRFLDMVATLKADGSLPTIDPEADGNAPVLYGLFDSARAELIEIFERHTKALITDGDSSVKQAFLGSVPELCMFFGTADSNDIILSHLNTYLNGRDWELKCAFFETIVGVATFLGGVTLEEFILPLMVQALTDPEEFVVEKVLRSLGHMAELGLFQRSKTWELVDVVGRFTMHPNIWIREAAAMFISSSTSFLSMADRQCIVLPLIRPYLKSDIRDFSELRLLDALKKPLSRPVLDLATNWALKVDRGTFWKSAPRQKTFSFGSTNHTIPSFSAKDTTQNALAKVPKNEEDEQWIVRLRTQGMLAEDEFKLVALQEYIWKTSHLKTKEPVKHPEYLNEVINLRKFGITPQTVMFDEGFEESPENRKSRPEDTDKPTHTIADALLDASLTIDDTSSRRRQKGYSNHQARLEEHNSTLSASDKGSKDPSPARSAPGNATQNARQSSAADKRQRPASDQIREPRSTGRASDDDSVSTTSTRRGGRQQSSAMSLLGRNDTAKSFPKTSTTSTNAFGRVEGPFKGANHPATDHDLMQKTEEIKKTDIKYRAAHTYSGNDPSILQMLDAMYVENYPDNVLEFGPMVTPISRRKPITRSTVQSVEKPWKPAGILVAQFSEHAGPVNRVVVAPDHMFFLTAGDDGTVKLWDTGRLERNIAHRSRQTHRHAAGAKVKSICFIENTHCFASCASDGSVNVVKVDFVYRTGVASARYGKLKVIRDYQLPKDEYVVWCDHFRIETSSVLMLATNKSRIIALDLRTMTILYELENSVHHGAPTCFLVDRKRQWILIGTSHGILDLWDLRFRVRVRSWGVPGATAISRLSFHPYRGKGRWVCVAGGSKHGEITIWDLEKFQCREVYRPGGGEDRSPGSYDPWPVDDDKPEGMLERFATTHDLTTSNVSTQGIFAMTTGTDAYEDGTELRYGYLITGGPDRKLRFWDMADSKHSAILSGLEAEDPRPVYTISRPTTNLTVNVERLPRPHPQPTAPNAAAGSRSSSSNSKGQDKKSSRPTVMTLHQQLLLRTHLDAITDVALLEAPYGMTVSVDRSGCTYVFQ